MQAQRARLPGGRWHFSHGPIDLILLAEGQPDAVAQAHTQAWERFGSVLPELVSELPELRKLVGAGTAVQGPVARRMWRACAPLSAYGLTAMAAVAGAVSDEIICCYQRPGIVRAWVNNGGDIALHLTPGSSTRIGLCSDPRRLPGAAPAILDGGVRIGDDAPVRGVATSGWRGRSFSLGIADSVTVLARDAAAADAAATVIANAVDTGNRAIVRRPANALKDDTDLGDRLVTVDVPPLPHAVVAEALEAGVARAGELERQGLIFGAALVCQGQARVAGSRLGPARPQSLEGGSVFA
ncbi:MAG: UPF0280 family protein [Pigmentiphaga sp.]|uniref:UPF0280 family protein n=1 Tax=Pigmentiphaga sp. TaxID=1977564 RepID=UPI0029B1E274|nr:UPF0280 family protein [Pigmentiphaga sp.]MDX3905399.1 UPF0280 family protein [Pigmentiphaga sp.]